MIIENILELSEQVFESHGKPADQVIISPFLSDLINEESKTIIVSACIQNQDGYHELRLMDMKVVVSKFVEKDEITFKYGNGEFVRLRVNLQAGKPTGGTVQLPSEEYRRVTLGEE